MQESLLSQGFVLLSFGMGTVFVFLGLLVIVTTGVSRIIVNYFPEIEQPAETPKSPTPNSAVSPRTIQIIKAAIEQHRAKRR